MIGCIFPPSFYIHIYSNTNLCFDYFSKVENLPANDGQFLIKAITIHPYRFTIFGTFNKREYFASYFLPPPLSAALFINHTSHIYPTHRIKEITDVKKGCAPKISFIHVGTQFIGSTMEANFYGKRSKFDARKIGKAAKA